MQPIFSKAKHQCNRFAMRENIKPVLHVSAEMHESCVINAEKHATDDKRGGGGGGGGH